MATIRIGTWTFEPERRELRRGEERQHLTELEHDLLAYLARRAGETVAADELLREVWKYAPTVQSRAVPNTARRLRRKLEPEPSKPRYLQTVWGAGYRFAELGGSDDSRQAPGP